MSLLRAGLGADETLHRALEAMGRRKLRDLLPPLLATARPGVSEVVDFLESSQFGGDTELRARARIAVLGRQVSEGAVRSSAIWGQLDPERLPWSVELVEIGRELWPRLGPARLGDVERVIEVSVENGERQALLRAALRVVALEGMSESLDQEGAFDAVQRLSSGPAQIHWYLRALATRSGASGRGTRRRVAAVGRYLAGNPFEIPAADLSRYLDLVTAHLPERLERLAEAAVWSPSSTPDTLRTLASRAHSRKLLEFLLGSARKYAAVLADDEAEGFELRREVLILAACRLATRWGDLTGVERAAE